MKTKPALVATCLLLACSALAQTPDSVDQSIRSEMQKRQIPRLALLIIRHGNIVKAQG